MGINGLLRVRIGVRRPMGANLSLVDARLVPKLAGDGEWVDAGLFPPSTFVTDAMHLPMMYAAKWDYEFVAGFAAERPRLGIAKMMRVGGSAPADQACLAGDGAKVIPVAVAPRLGNRQQALVDAGRPSAAFVRPDRIRAWARPRRIRADGGLGR